MLLVGQALIYGECPKLKAGFSTNKNAQGASLGVFMTREESLSQLLKGYL
jgi:hypothetical protein